MALAPSNLLALPLRQTSHLPGLTQALCDVIALQYDENPDVFRADIKTLQEAREKVTALAPDAQGLDVLVVYWRYLRSITQKFPPDIGIEFPWALSFAASGSRDTTRGIPDLRYEKLNILYNIAALYSQLGCAENRLIDDGLKRASAHFQNAAGSIALLIDYTADTPVALTPTDLPLSMLQVYKHLLLAQAQECYWQRAAKDCLKDATIAKLAAKTSEFYKIAHDFASSAANAGLLPTPWLSHLLMKQYHFAGASHYRKAVEALGSNRYGEEVARLQVAQHYTDKARKLVKTVSPLVASDFESLSTAVAQALVRAERDNSLIYLDPIPLPASLTPIAKSEVVKCIIPAGLVDTSKSDTIFAALVPYPVHAAIALYKDRKEQIRDALETLQEQLSKMAQSKLHALGLPALLDAVVQPTGLPPSVLARGEEIKLAGGCGHLYRQMEDISVIALQNRDLLDRCFDILDSFAADTDLPRQTRTEQEALCARASQYQKTMESAALSDAQLRQRLDRSTAAIDRLVSSREQLAKTIPLGRSQGPGDDVSTSALRDVVKRLESMKWEGQGIVQAARSAFSVDTASAAIRREAETLARDHPEMTLETLQFESIISKSLAGLQVYTDRLGELQDKQNGLLLELEKSHAAFVQTRTKDPDVSARESFLKSLDTAYIAWREISDHLLEASKFYGRLGQLLSNLYREVNDCAQRHSTTLDAQISNLDKQTAALNVGATTERSPSLVPIFRPGEWKGGPVKFG